MNDAAKTAQTGAQTVIASIDDIDRENAEAAYRGVSWSPERRGEQDRADYAADVNGLYEELSGVAATEAQKEVLDREIIRYRDGYRARLVAFHASYSRCVSTMIAGPSNFPVRRQEKRGDAAHRKLSKLVEWRSEAKAAIRKKIADARPQEVKAKEERRRLLADVHSSLATVGKIDSGELRGYTRAAFVGSIVGKVERLANAGEVAIVEAALDSVRKWNEGRKKPAIAARNKFWGLADVARAAAVVLAADAASGPEVVAEVDGASIVSNPRIGRVQIVFDAIPDQETRGRLKAEGWKWSRREGAWQRKRTAAAVESARRIVGVGERSADAAG